MAVMTLVEPIRTLALALSLALAGGTPAGAQTESSIPAQDGGTIKVESGGVTAGVKVKGETARPGRLTLFDPAKCRPTFRSMASPLRPSSTQAASYVSASSAR